jgi:hypothetical protein
MESLQRRVTRQPGTSPTSSDNEAVIRLMKFSARCKQEVYKASLNFLAPISQPQSLIVDSNYCV